MASGVPVTTFLLGVECWKPLARRDRSLLSRSERLLPISRWTRDKFVAGTVATTIGVLFPWLLSRLGRDPAYGSGPIGTIVQDVLSLVIYFITISVLVL